MHTDILRIFNHVLMQQTRPQDSHGAKTITSIYSNWYLEVLLRRVSSGDIVYSPIQKAFVTLPVEGQVPFCAEEYSDVTGRFIYNRHMIFLVSLIINVYVIVFSELRSLAELIGSYGMMYCNENLMWHITSQVNELKVFMFTCFFIYS